MKLQLALDILTLERALAILEEVSDFVDWIEVGTPMIKRYGIQAVRTVRAAFPEHTLVADMKTMDAGRWEAGLAFDAGADVVTVLACADDATLQAALREAEPRDRRVCVDLLGVADVITRARKVIAMGATLIGVHAGSDQQAQGENPLAVLKAIRAAVPDHAGEVAVAGGIKPENVDRYLALAPDIIIVGSGITGAGDPAAAARELQQAIHRQGDL